MTLLVFTTRRYTSTFCSYYIQNHIPKRKSTRKRQIETPSFVTQNQVRKLRFLHCILALLHYSRNKKYRVTVLIPSLRWNDNSTLKENDHNVKVYFVQPFVQVPSGTSRLRFVHSWLAFFLYVKNIFLDFSIPFRLLYYSRNRRSRCIF